MMKRGCARWLQKRSSLLKCGCDSLQRKTNLNGSSGIYFQAASQVLKMLAGKKRGICPHGDYDHADYST